VKVAVLDDWQHTARASADWSALEQRAEIVVFDQPAGDENEVAARLADADIIMAMRERTPFPASLIARLPALKMFNITGHRARLVDMAAMVSRDIVVSTTGGGDSGAPTAELALALMLASARGIPAGDAAVRAGHFQLGTSVGFQLAGKTLGIIGLGRIGQAMARYGHALGMRVLAWSPNLTEATARAGGAEFAAKNELLAQSDVVSLHLVLSPRTAGVLGRESIALMKPGAILVNTSRAGLIDTPSLHAALRDGRLIAALDVFDIEPLPPDDPLLALPNTVLTPHVGYGTIETFREFYRESIDNVIAFLDGTPRNLFQP
jgi:phosphoglycerate dehydrogenase-like enzyme